MTGLIFADAWYWVALLNPEDQHHSAAIRASRGLADTRLVTTDEVLIEMLAHMSARGALLRGLAVETVRSLVSSPRVDVIPQTRESFMFGVDLYAERPDKAYSLTDCISMLTMRRLAITEVLTADQHFRQEGFTLLPEET
jgi:predicted nucleic acid-binding protein